MKPCVTIAGSGPSSEGFEGPVTIATKKRPVKSEYIAVACITAWERFGPTDIPVMVFRGQHKATDIRWWASEKAWLKYFLSFKDNSTPRKLDKPSVGTMAVFMAAERWKPEEIQLIGFDWVLDKNPDWFHDARAEYDAIHSLGIKITDLRDRRAKLGEQ